MPLVEKSADIHDLLAYSHIWKSRSKPATTNEHEEQHGAEESEPLLDAHGAAMRSSLNFAWQFWKEDAFDACIFICTEIVATPQTSDFHKAMAHYMLAHGENEFVYVKACHY